MPSLLSLKRLLMIVTEAITPEFKSPACWAAPLTTQLLTVNATSSNSQSTLNVFLASNNQLLGTMVSQGNGTFTFQAPFTTGTPASINVKSNLGGSTGQGVSVIP